MIFHRVFALSPVASGLYGRLAKGRARQRRTRGRFDEPNTVMRSVLDIALGVLGEPCAAPASIIGDSIRDYGALAGQRT